MHMYVTMEILQIHNFWMNWSRKFQEYAWIPDQPGFSCSVRVEVVFRGNTSLMNIILSIPLCYILFTGRIEL